VRVSLLTPRVLVASCGQHLWVLIFLSFVLLFSSRPPVLERRGVLFPHYCLGLAAVFLSSLLRVFFRRDMPREGRYFSRRVFPLESSLPSGCGLCRPAISRLLLVPGLLGMSRSFFPTVSCVSRILSASSVRKSFLPPLSCFCASPPPYVSALCSARCAPPPFLRDLSDFGSPWIYLSGEHLFWRDPFPPPLASVLLALVVFRFPRVALDYIPPPWWLLFVSSIPVTSPCV